MHSLNCTLEVSREKKQGLVRGKRDRNQKRGRKRKRKKEGKNERKKKKKKEKTNEVAVCFLTCTGLDWREHDALRLEKRDGFLALGEDLELQRPNTGAQLQGLE